MEEIQIRHESEDDKYFIVRQINNELLRRGLQIKFRLFLFEPPDFPYDDNDVYRTGERQLDTRIDCTGVRRDAAL